MLNFLKQLHKDDSGQDMIEYALIGLIIALGALAGMSTLASSINKRVHQNRGQLNLNRLLLPVGSRLCRRSDRS